MEGAHSDAVQDRRAPPALPRGVHKKRLSEGFVEALAAYLDGAAVVCKIEPQYADFYPDKIAGPQADPAEQQRARAYIDGLEGLQCSKIQADPSACWGCPDNPDDGGQRKRRAELLQVYGDELLHVERLYDAARLGLLRLEDLTALEFDQVRFFDRAVMRRRSHF